MWLCVDACERRAGAIKTTGRAIILAFPFDELGQHGSHERELRAMRMVEWKWLENWSRRQQRKWQ